jgi:predicted GTPase
VIAVSAVRTGCGKSQTALWLATELTQRGHRVVSLRHPMPYGDLTKQRVQRFASYADLDVAECTAEEREEYEPYVEADCVIYAGVDYAAILAEAEREADVILWDGGNNDFPFIRPDWHLVIVDALRPDQLTTHYPGEAVLRMADVVVINKVAAAARADVQRISDEVHALLGDVPIVRASSPVVLDDPAAVAGRRVIVIDDGPTLTHGGMSYGAGYVAASAASVSGIVDPRPHAVGSIRETYEKYPHLSSVLPAMGYGALQLEDLRNTIEASGADVVVSGTPLDLARLISLEIPVVRARYAYADTESPLLGDLLSEFLTALHPSSEEIAAKETP